MFPCDRPEFEVGFTLKCTMHLFDFNFRWNKSTNLVKLPDLMFKEYSFSALYAVLLGLANKQDMENLVGEFSQNCYTKSTQGNRILCIGFFFVMCGHFNCYSCALLPGFIVRGE
jgi:hypothetical protein